MVTSFESRLEANNMSSTQLDAAVRAFRHGEPVLISDAADREGEIDLCYPAEAVEPRDVARLRNDAGGLVCVALAHEVADAFELPFRHEALDHPITTHAPSYDDRPSFSLSVNHTATRTGITDRDRALTIRELAAAAAAPMTYPFIESFRAPGHVNILRAADGLLASRQGHTELGMMLARMAGIAPAVVVCEMLDDNTGRACTLADARAYAHEHDFVFLGQEALHSLAAPVAEPDPQRS